MYTVTSKTTRSTSTDKTISVPPGIDNRETSQIQLNHIDGENIDDERNTEITLIIRMLKIEHEYVTKVESKYYHIEIINSKPQQPENNQKNHTLHI